MLLADQAKAYPRVDRMPKHPSQHLQSVKGLLQARKTSPVSPDLLCCGECSDIKFFSLVRALVSQPTLSQQVQSLRISYAQTPDLDDRNWCDYEEYRTPYSIADWNFLTNAVKDRLPWFTFCPRNPIWENTNITVTEIQSRDSDIECSLKYLVFAHLPNLGTLHLSFRVSKASPEYRHTSFISWHIPLHLQQAKKLFIYGEDAQTPFRLCGRMFWHWYLPSTLTDLCFRNCELVLADSDGSFFPETWSIKKISLVDCTMPSDALSELTNDVFPLEEFEYVVNSKSEDKVAFVTAAETIGRLKSYSASLVKLRLRFRLSDGKPIREDEEPYNPSDFCDFKKLKTLVVHLVNFGFTTTPTRLFRTSARWDSPRAFRISDSTRFFEVTYATQLMS
ncbi:hypothetical protein CFIO01_02138 [Colletotrichum fioriniae PJ7]|uniref:Uncharacterized protein n=1 Tax=Colletotrichum fioriniae PJ7 TaxID=1445577 RepID=A0A010R893_9PEZI|nr:hypothetical protein CFIO01_02138 [Colletotrichum fioriniae PJ7]